MEAGHAARDSDETNPQATSASGPDRSSESAHPSERVEDTSASRSAQGKTAAKRKVNHYQAPILLPEVRSVLQQVFHERQQARKSSRSVIEISPSCMGECGKTNIAMILFNHSNSLFQMERDNVIRAFCKDCGLQRNLLRPPQPLAEPVARAETSDNMPLGAGEQRGDGDGCKRCD